MELAATFNGYIDTTYDALVVFEACLSGRLSLALRRPRDYERRELIQSGNVFIFKEGSGLKRWTDGVNWSPSRILDNFLVYRELERSLGTGRQRKAKKMRTGAIPNTNNEDRRLISSLVNSYDFKHKGLVKKTTKITFQGEAYHLVCYYTCNAIKDGQYTTPSKHSMLQSIIPRSELMCQQFKAPIFGDARADGIYNYSSTPVQTNFDYGSTVISQGGNPMDYPPGLAGLHYPHKQTPWTDVQLQQHEQQQPVVPYYLP
ncbi:hypothetical protein NCS52_01577100 [Fusarium sp. LHS14.1]|nr:hypothetical protein NCS52_01577100 [Fusarium sp. LHS14.1]